MELTLIRHAEAADAGPDGDDGARPLTRAGKRTVRAVAVALARIGVGAELLIHSPLLRASQTAELLVPLLARDGETRASSLLAESPGASILDLLGGLATERVALVGHAPALSQLAAWLVAGDRAAAERFPLGKGGAAWLRGEPRAGAMQLVAWLPSGVSSRVAEGTSR